MATTRPYINHLLQNTGITPACSEEERAAAEDIAHIFARHGFEPEVQEFSASGSKKIVTAVLGIAAFLGALFIGIGGALGFVGILLTLAAAVLYTMERMGKTVLSGLGAGGLSQNVIAYHKASGPLASPRNRPVVVVAHYDSPRADILSQMPYALYRPLMAKLMPATMVAPAVIAVLRVFPFPDAVKTVLWLLGIVAALVPLANAVAIIMNRFILPYTTGSVCNKSSVAAMLGVMNAVAPFKGENEFPADVPFDEYFAEQRRIAEELAAQAAAAAEAEASEEELEPLEEDAESGEDEQEPPVDETAADEVPAPAPALEEVSAADRVDASEEEVDPGATQAMDMSAIMGGISSTAVAAGSAVVDAPTEAIAPAEAIAAEPDDVTDAPAAEEAVDDQPADEDGEPSIINAAGNYRYGVDALRALGMVSDECVIEYDMPEPEPESEPEPEPEPEAAPAPVAPVAVAAADAVAQTQDAASDEQVADAADDGFAYTEDAYIDDTYEDDYTEEYGEAYEDEGLEFSRRGMPLAPAPAQSSFATAFSAVSEGAARFFGNALKRGKSAISEIEQVARDAAAKRAAAREEAAREEAERAAEMEAREQEDAAASEEEALDRTIASSALKDDDGAAQDAAPAPDDTIVAEAPAPDADDAAEQDPSSTQVFTPEDDAADSDATVATPAAAAPLPGETVAVPTLSAQQEALNARRDADRRPVETVDSLMAQITASRPQQSAAPQQAAPQARRAPMVVPDPAQPSLHQPAVSNRASLFDLPDPAASGDPFAPEAAPSRAGMSVPSVEDDRPATPTSTGFTVISSPAPASGQQPQAFETISADAPVASGRRNETAHRGMGGLFRRKKKSEPSMSEYLGVDDDFDAKNSGRSIGSWDNFEDDDWKGGATGAEDIEPEQLRDAITSMDDDELLGHDIWFVATGASEYDHAGMRAFLNTHRDKLRGVFLINLECVGAGQIAMLSTEGERRVLKGDKRIMNLVRRVSSAFHNEFGAIDMPYLSTDSYAAMSMSLRSLTIAGVDGPRLACSHSEEDQPFNVDTDNINMVADVVTEVIRRS